MRADLSRNARLSALLLALAAGPLWAAPPMPVGGKEATAQHAADAGEADSGEEDWGIWNKTPRRDGPDPLLALDKPARRAAPEPIDAAARGEFAVGVGGREFDLDGWGGGDDIAGPSDPDDGT
jgi:hypothetical protein